jgi:hypothetical protein
VTGPSSQDLSSLLNRSRLANHTIHPCTGMHKPTVAYPTEPTRYPFVVGNSPPIHQPTTHAASDALRPNQDRD